MGRVYRQGQTKPCTIYRFFSAGTVEEVIYQRQTQKGGLATLTVDAESNKKKKSKKNASNTNTAKFSKEELRDCFTLKMDCVCDTKQKVGKRWTDYGGPAGLRSLGCTDEPLLTVAETVSNTLRFVHIVDDEQDVDDEGDSSSDEAEEDLGLEEESSDSENEFD